VITKAPAPTIPIAKHFARISPMTLMTLTLQLTLEIQVLQCDELRGVLGQRHGGVRCCKSAAGADDCPALILARLVGAVRRLDGGAEFAEEHQVALEWAAKAPAKRIGRMPMLLGVELRYQPA
jgi:hypothetical protein